MHSTARIAVAAVALVSFGAFAQTTPTDIDADDTDVNVNVNPPAVDVDTDDDIDVDAYDYDDGRPNLISRIGVAADIGGGVHELHRTKASHDITDTGGSWEARLTVGTCSFLAGEFAYVGTANQMTRPRRSTTARFWCSNGFEGLLASTRAPAIGSRTPRRRSTRTGALKCGTPRSTRRSVANADNDAEIPVGRGPRVSAAAAWWRTCGSWSTPR